MTRHLRRKARVLGLIASIIALVGAHATLGIDRPAPPDLTAQVEQARSTVPPSDVLVFVLDSAVDSRFVEGRAMDLRSKDVTHGSLVARVVRGYCSAPIVGVPVEDRAGSVDRAAYLSGLEGIVRYVRANEDMRVVVNVSLGSLEPDDEEHQLIRQLTHAGAVVVAAAGNDDAELAVYPAAYTGVVAVASATKKGKALDSNYGPHIAICASGDISFIDYEFLPYDRLRREMEARGTSFAAPRVSATLAYVLGRRPGLSPRRALAILNRTASPISDPRFEERKLGVGLLDIYEAKSAVNPLYRWLHYGLPVAVCALLGLASVFMCVRHGLVGLFLSLMLWLVGLPAGLVLIVGVKGYLEFVGAGFTATGPAPFVIVGAGLLAALVLLRRSRLRRLLKFLALLVLVGLVLRLAGLEPLAMSVFVAAAAVTGAAVLELRTRAALARIRALPEGATVEDAVASLAAAYERAGDRRLRDAALAAVTKLPPDEAAELLLAHRTHPRGAQALLAALRARVAAGLPPSDSSEDGESDTDLR